AHFIHKLFLSALLTWIVCRQRSTIMGPVTQMQRLGETQFMDPQNLITILNMLALSMVAAPDGGMPQELPMIAPAASSVQRAEAAKSPAYTAVSEQSKQENPSADAATKKREEDTPKQASATAARQPRLLYGAIADFYYSHGLNHSFNGKNALRYPEI